MFIATPKPLQYILRYKRVELLHNNFIRIHYIVDKPSHG